MISMLAISCISDKDLLNYVDPFIGTGGHGHTYPGATVPFGMLQISPDTRSDNSWDGCGGYHYSDSAIIGFSHTHLSGVGVPDYCDILFLPHQGEISLVSEQYRSNFNHSTETASPGYYSVYLEDYKVKVQLTATERAAMQEYSYDGDRSPRILVDLAHRDKVIDSHITAVSKNRIEGYRVSKDWAANQRVFFVAEFSKPIKEFKLYNGKEITTKASGTDLQAIIIFEDGTEKITVRSSISSVSVEGASANLASNIDHFNFEKVKLETEKVWTKNLEKIKVEGGTEEEKTLFYTGLYHSLLTPNLYSDVDNRYWGMDGKIHTTESKHYTVFSLWDTFRNLHPLLTITHPEETEYFISSLVDKADQWGTYPMWELAANDTRCMIGYHAVSIIADAYMKGIRGFDIDRAYDAMKRTANDDRRGLYDYKRYGFVSSNRSSQSVSKTLEYAYNDWCISQIAKELKQDDDYEEFAKRANFYRNIFNPETGFMHGRNFNREFVPNFDPTAVGYNYTEGNSFQYSYFVPHDIKGLASLKGGIKPFELWIDQIFNTEITEDLGDDSDVTGLIGNYSHGNEPSHYIAYLYNYTGKPWKSQARVSQIMREHYKATPDGISGNEDCGQMSAWYVMSAMGLFSHCPGQPEYTITTPIFDKVVISNDSGNKFVITANRDSEDDIYINDIRLNGKVNNRVVLSHNELVKGGTLELNLTSSTPKTTFSEPSQYLKDRPVSYLDGDNDNLEYLVSNKTSHLNIRDLNSGLECSYYQGIFRSVYDYEFEEPATKSIVNKISLEPLETDEWTGLEFNGYIDIPADGIYTFKVDANDGCAMWIDGLELFESDGRKSVTFSQQVSIKLKRGLHSIRLGYFQCSDKKELKAYWKTERSEFGKIPSSILYNNIK